MFKKIDENSFEFVKKPQVVMLRSTEEFWRVVQPNEVMKLIDSVGMPIEYSTGQKAWYPALSEELFVKPEPKKEIK